MNPRDMVLMMLSRNQNNPVMQNLLQMAQNNDGAGLEQFARNMAAEKGIDYDTAFAQFKQQYRL